MRNEISNVGPVWMHLTWAIAPLVTLIIWIVIKNKHPYASIHGKNILNAFFTLIIINVAVSAILVIFGCVVGYLADNGVPTEVIIVPGIILGLAVIVAIWIPIRVIVASIMVAIATGKGETSTYSRAIQFFKTQP